LQPNIPQSIRNDPNKEDNVRAEGNALADRAMQSNPQLIVWPETSFGKAWHRMQPNLNWKKVREWWDARVRPKLEPEADVDLAWKSFVRWWHDKHRETNDTIREITQRWPNTPLLLGVTCVVLDDNGERIHNTAVFIDATGNERDLYHKMYRVPFGEYIPWEDTLPFMRWLSPYEGDYSIRAGEQHTVFTLSGERPTRFAVLICYEDTVPHLVGDFIRNPHGGEPPDFFLNISNDGWFRGTEEHEQHMVAARFRAIETRRSVARAVNMGISGVIDPYGRVTALPGPTWSESKGTSGVVVAAVPICKDETIYSRWGDVLPGGCWIIVAAGFVWSWRRRQSSQAT
jgi:apolipoprotein N-acyltransferase